MCSICNCFAWTLDLFQRALTFCLSCWLAFAVSCGLLIAVIAGIAYGYNYCLAEFVTLARSDIRVYMKRGQFYDRPDLLHIKRRMGDDEEVDPYNLTNDYQQDDQSSDETALLNKWMKDQDTRKYAEKLMKYSENQKTLDDRDEQSKVIKIKQTNNDIKYGTMDDSFYKFKTASAWHSIANSTISTSLQHSSDIITKTFEIIFQTEESDSIENDHNDVKVNRVLDRALAKTERNEEENAALIPSADIQIPQRPQSNLMNMRFWRTTPVIENRSPDTEDNIIYKSI